MEHGLTAGGRKEHALPRSRGATAGVLGHIRQHLEEGGPGLLDPELLLDLPLGVKIPVPRSSKPVFCRAKLGEKLQRPSGFYDLGDPYCRQLRTEYNSLHDPYLQEYHRHREHFQRLRSQGLITSDGRVVSTLKEFNDYRQYLTKLKLQAEHVFRQEEERLQKYLAKLTDAQKPPGAIYPSRLGERLQQPRRPTSPAPAKGRKTSSKSGPCWRLRAVLEEGQACSRSQPGQEGAEPPRRVSPEAGSEPSLASTLPVRTKAPSTLASLSEPTRQPGPVLPHKPDSGKCLTEAPRQEGKERSPAEDALPSTGPKSFLQPVPPAGPKPPAPTGVRRRLVRLKPIKTKAELPVLDTREYMGKPVDNVLCCRKFFCC